MTFTFETEYNQNAIKVMAEAMRKSIRRKKNRRSRILGWILAAAAILLTLPVLKGEAEIQFTTVLNWGVAAVMIVTLLFEDAINGFFAKRRMLAGTNHAVAVFEAGSYTSTTSAGKTEFPYSVIRAIAENEDYFVFALDQRYAQIYDKHNLTGGSAEQFRAFISEKTGKEVVSFGKN